MDDTLNPTGEEQAPVVAEPKYESLNFTGDGTEYFKIWIVNLLLNMITLGIYGAWAKVRIKKYIYSKTKFRGHALDYHGKPLPILKGRIVAGLIFAFYFFGSIIHPIMSLIGFALFIVCTPFFFVKSLQFNVNNTSYQNIRFHYIGKAKEAFKIYGKYFGPQLVLTGLMLLFFSLTGQDTANQAAQNPQDPELAMKGAMYGLVTMGVGLFNLIYTLVIASSLVDTLFKFVYNNTFYGGSRLNLDSNKKDVSQAVVKPILLLYFGGVFLFVFALIVGVFLSKIIPAIAFLAPIMLIAFYIYILYLSLKVPYLIIDYIWNRVSLEDEGVFKSTLEFWPYFKLGLINLFLIGLTLGFYTPWAKMEMLALKLNSRKLKMGDLDSVTASAQSRESAISEEISEAFDFGFEIGL